MEVQAGVVALSSVSVVNFLPFVQFVCFHQGGSHSFDIADVAARWSLLSNAPMIVVSVALMTDDVDGL
jgi:hypothetical protein